MYVNDTYNSFAILLFHVTREVLTDKVFLTSCVSYSDFFLCFKKLILHCINIISDIVILTHYIMDKRSTPYKVQKCSTCPGDKEYYCESCPCNLSLRCKSEPYKNFRNNRPLYCAAP